jgi:hypothetical protein
VPLAGATQREIDARTIRDCPNGMTEFEFKTAVAALEKKLNTKHERCSKCGHSLGGRSKYVITETPEWLGSDAKLPRSRWAVHTKAHTLRDARQFQRLLGPKAVIWVRESLQENGATYKKLPKKKKR